MSAAFDEGKDNYIYLSYSHNDIKEVLELVGQLRDHGYNVWFDENADPSAQQGEAAAQHIENCAYFIGYITNNYLKSQDCLKELDLVRYLDKNRLFIYGDDAELSGGMRMRMNRLQAIYRSKYPDPNDFYEKIFNSHGIGACRNKDAIETAKKPETPVTDHGSADKKSAGKGLAIAAVFGLIILGILVLGPNMKPADYSEMVESVGTVDMAEESADTASEFDPYADGVELDYRKVSHQGVSLEVPAYWHEEAGSSWYRADWDEEYAYEYYNDDSMRVEIARSSYDDNAASLDDYYAGAMRMRDVSVDSLLDDVFDVEEGSVEIDGTECYWFKYTQPQVNEPDNTWITYFIPIDSKQQLTVIYCDYVAGDHVEQQKEMAQHIIDSISIDQDGDDN